MRDFCERGAVGTIFPEPNGQSQILGDLSLSGPGEAACTETSRSQPGEVGHPPAATGPSWAFLVPLRKKILLPAILGYMDQLPR